MRRAITAGWGAVDDGQLVHHLRVVGGEVVGDGAAPVVAHHVRGAARLQVPGELVDVRGQRVEVIPMLGPIRAAIAAQVRRHGVEARGAEHREHLAPALGQLREAVQEQDERPMGGARLERLHAQGRQGQGERREWNHGPRNLTAWRGSERPECPDVMRFTRQVRVGRRAHATLRS